MVLYTERARAHYRVIYLLLFILRLTLGIFLTATLHTVQFRKNAHSHDVHKNTKINTFCCYLICQIVYLVADSLKSSHR